MVSRTKASGRGGRGGAGGRTEAVCGGPLEGRRWRGGDDSRWNVLEVDPGELGAVKLSGAAKRS